jgi:RsiW-degrading membrane proteinase PrsW (M82 family)
MTDYKPPRSAVLLTVLAMLAALVSGLGVAAFFVDNESVRAVAFTLLIGGVASLASLLWMIAIVEYLAKIHHALTRNDKGSRE